jgi:hypothetical protein
VANVSEDNRGPVLASGQPATDAVARARAEPSWGRVLATTIELWLARRLHPVRFVGISGGRNRLRWRPGQLGRLTAGRWRLSALILALAIAAAAVLMFTSVLTGTDRPTVLTTSPSSADAHGISSQAAATAQAEAEAAAWIADQVSIDAIVGCDPAMCTALQAHAVTASQLLPLGPGSAGPPGADVIVTSASTGSRFSDAYAPAVIASFGSGGSRIEVRVIARDGAASYESALRADLAARQSAGTELLRNPRIRFGAREARQLRRGEVDSRLLATLAALSTQYSFRVTAFGDSSPGAQTLFRAMTITGRGKKGAPGLAAALATVNAQEPPYRPDHAALIRPAIGHTSLRVEFTAPSPLGLLTTVLAVDQPRAAALTQVIARAIPVLGIDQTRGK